MDGQNTELFKALPLGWPTLWSLLWSQTTSLAMRSLPEPRFPFFVRRPRATRRR